MPWGDAQFWIVTLVAFGGAWLVWRGVRPSGSKRRHGVRATLTVSGSGDRGG